MFSNIGRHDYLPFGEGIGSGTGLPTPMQRYGATDTNRQKYGLTERDDATGLDHTWWRKYDSFAGRWTSPDPHGGSMSIGDAQSFNRYNYTHNDPVNFIDPSGLYSGCIHKAMTNFLAKLSGRYTDQQAAALAHFASSERGGADSFKYAATNPINFFKSLFHRGPSAEIHFASEATLAKNVGKFPGYIAAGDFKHAGFVLHSIEDVDGAHQGYGLPFGHAGNTLEHALFGGKDVDHTIGDAKFTNAANAVYQVLSGNSSASLTGQQMNELISAIVAQCGANNVKVAGSGPAGGGGGGGGSGGGGGGYTCAPYDWVLYNWIGGRWVEVARWYAGCY